MADENLNRLQELQATLEGLTSIEAQLRNQVSSGAASTANLINSVSKSFQILVDIEKEQVKSLDDVERGNKELLKLKKAQVKIDLRRVILLKRAETATEAQLENIEAQLYALIETSEQLKMSQAVTSAMSQDFAEMKKNSRFFKELSNSIKAIPGLGPILSKPLEDASEVAAERGKLAGFFKFLNSTVKLLSGPALVKGLLTISSQTKDLRTNLGISNTQARNLRKEFTAYAQTTENSRVNTDSLVTAQNQLSSELGLGVTFSGETLENFIDQTKALEVSVKAASRLALVQESLGDTSGVFADNLALSAKEAGAALGVNLSSKEVFEEVGNLSASTLLTLRRNPQALGQAVAEAKKLGIRLADVRGIASSLLDFESSIANELEAEVLTGRELNLDRARLAALKGDDLALTREIASQVGTIAEFENMSVIQRQALAKSFGLNIDQMSEMLLKQEAINAVGDRANDLSKEALENAFKKSRQQGLSLEQALNEEQARANAAENFQNAATNLQNSFREFFVEFEPLLTKISSVMADLAKSPTFRGISLLGAGVAAGASILKKLQVIPQRVFVVNQGMSGGGGISGGLTRNLRGKRGLVSLRKMGRSGGIFGLAAGLAFEAGAGMAEEAGNESLASGLNYGSAIAAGAGTGAMLGSIIPGVGNIAGAVVGGGIGLLTEYLKQRDDKEDKAKEEAKKSQDTTNSYLQQLAERTGNIYMDGNQVGIATVQSAYRLP